MRVPPTWTHALYVGCAIMLGMRLLPRFGRQPYPAQVLVEGDPGVDMDEGIEAALRQATGDGVEKASHLFRTVGWVSAALGAVALGLVVGAELRSRYKFNHRTPYDAYAHSGDELKDVEWGVGI